MSTFTDLLILKGKFSLFSVAPHKLKREISQFQCKNTFLFYPPTPTIWRKSSSPQVSLYLFHQSYFMRNVRNLCMRVVCIHTPTAYML